MIVLAVRPFDVVNLLAVPGSNVIRRITKKLILIPKSNEFRDKP